jgi:hypothetical protein
MASGAMRELALNGHRQGRAPMRRRARTTSVMPHDLFGIPVESQDDGDPAETLSQHLGPVDAPPLVGPGRPRCRPARRPLGRAPELGLDQEVRLPHPPQHTLLRDDPALDAAQVNPDAAIPPARVVGCELPDPLEQACMAWGSRARAASLYSSHPSLFFHSRVSSPTRGISDGYAPSLGELLPGDADRPQRHWPHQLKTGHVMGNTGLG